MLGFVEVFYFFRTDMWLKKKKKKKEEEEEEKERLNFLKGGPLCGFVWSGPQVKDLGLEFNYNLKKNKNKKRKWALRGLLSAWRWVMELWVKLACWFPIPATPSQRYVPFPISFSLALFFCDWKFVLFLGFVCCFGNVIRTKFDWFYLERKWNA